MVRWFFWFSRLGCRWRFCSARLLLLARVTSFTCCTWSIYLTSTGETWGDRGLKRMKKASVLSCPTHNIDIDIVKAWLKPPHNAVFTGEP